MFISNSFFWQNVFHYIRTKTQNRRKPEDTGLAIIFSDFLSYSDPNIFPGPGRTSVRKILPFKPIVQREKQESRKPTAMHRKPRFLERSCPSTKSRSRTIKKVSWLTPLSGLVAALWGVRERRRLSWPCLLNTLCRWCIRQCRPVDMSDGPFEVLRPFRARARAIGGQYRG